MEPIYYSNYKCYTKKQRCAIFALEVKDKKLEVFILRCNLKDEFNKELARGVYEWYLTEGEFTNKKGEKIVVYQHYINDKPKAFHPEIILVPIEEGNSAKYTFIQFCANNFYRKRTETVRYEVDTLVSNHEQIIVSKPRRINKLSYKF